MDITNVPRRELYSVLEACHLLGNISRTTFYELVPAQLQIVKVRGRTLVAAGEIERFVKSLTGGATDARAA